MLLAVLLHLLLLLHHLTPSGFFNGMLEVSEPGALNFYTFFCLIPLTLFVSMNLTLIHLPLSVSVDSMLCDLIASTPDLAFSLLMPRTLAAVPSFSSGRAYPSLNFLPSLSLLDPYSDYVGVKLTNSKTDSFSASIFPSSKNLFILGDFIAITPSGNQKVLPIPMGRKYLIGSSLLTSSSSMTLTYLLFSIASLAVAPPLLPFLSPYLAHGSCFRTLVLITY